MDLGTLVVSFKQSIHPLHILTSKCVERKEGAMLPDGRKGLILHQDELTIHIK